MLFVAAEAREFSGLLKFCRSVKKLHWPVAWVRSAELNGRNVLLAANGAGPRLAAAALETARLAIPEGNMQAVVSTGFCGGLDPGLKIGAIFVANCIQVAGELAAIEVPRSRGEYSSGTLVSTDRVAQTAEQKRDLRSSGASAIEMEAAGILPRVREWEVPFYCIRSVTDLANESFTLDFNTVRDSDGRFSTPRILAAAIRRPFTVGSELMELRNRCDIAARSLGEFIANCSF
jgi:adenosylhomocysteine nucleosidase